MEDERKTKKQLIEELNELRQSVTELKSFKEEIKQTRVNQEKFTKAFRQNSIPLTISTVKEGRFVDVSDAFLRLVECKRDEVIGHTSREAGFITDEQRAHFHNELSKSGSVEDFEMEVTPKGRGLRYGLFNAVMMSYNNENYLLTTIQDITDRKQAEATLYASESKYRSLHKSMMDAFVNLDMEGRIKDCNDVYLDMLGYTPEEINTLTYKEITPKKWHMLEAAIFGNQVLTRGYSDIYEKEYRKKDGTIFPVELRTTLIRNSQGTPESMWAIVRDISERKHLEDLLVKSEEKFRLITENMMDCVALVDTNNTYQYVTPSYREILGYDAEDMIGISVFNLIHPDDLERIKRIYREGIEQSWREINFETRLRHRNGHYLTMEIKAGVFNNPQGKIMGGVIAARDITERKQMEEELLRAHKLESLGTLAGGIAHDFNNLMAIVQGYISLALMDLPSNHASRQNLLTAMRSVDQTKDLTSRLITFSRGGGPLKETFDVTDILQDAVQRTVKETKIKVKFDFMENLWPADADELQMKQVFYNLTTNAVEAMPEGGNLTISVENALMPAGELPDMKKGSYLKIIFTDEGLGIPEDRLAKIFDPYFTTKNMGAQKGLGLGLTVCYSVLKNHEGHITVKSTPGEGASFILYIPVQLEPQKEKEVCKKSSTGTVRVLIMDDEPNIREIERTYLELMGHEVTDVNDGQEAIDAFKKALNSGNPFDLVLLDLTIRRGMGGKLTMERLLTIDPSVRAIIASGFADDPVIENYADYGFLGSLKKPFKGEEMNSLVEKVLNG